ncbi:MAG: O-antigen ligase family protein [Solirubrobacterales bacterium]
MTSTPANQMWPPPVLNTRSTVRWASVIVLACVGSLLAAVAAAGMSSIDPLILVLAGSVPVAVALSLIAVSRFEVFVWILIAIRPSLDLLGAGELSPGAMAAAMFLVVGSLWLIVQYRFGDSFPLSRTTWWLGAFAGAALLSAFTSELRSQSSTAVLEILSGIVMFLVLEQLLAEKPARVKVLLAVVLASAIVPVLVGLVQIAGGGADDGRISGPFPHPSPYGTFLVPVILVVSALATTARGSRRIVLLVALIPLGLTLTYTFHRAGWISLVVGVLYLGLRRSRWIVISLVVIAGFAVVAVPSVSDRLSDLGGSEEWVPEGVPENSWQWRLQYWEYLIPLGAESPFTGIGPQVVVATEEEAREPHNVFVQVWVEFGAFGLVTILGAGLAFSAALRARRRAAVTDWDDAVAVAAIAVALAFLAQALSENLLNQTAAWWLLAAATTWGYRTARPPRSTLQPSLTGPVQRPERVEQIG